MRDALRREQQRHRLGGYRRAKKHSLALNGGYALGEVARARKCAEVGSNAQERSEVCTRIQQRLTKPAYGTDVHDDISIERWGGRARLESVNALCADVENGEQVARRGVVCHAAEWPITIGVYHVAYQPLHALRQGARHLEEHATIAILGRETAVRREE